MTRFSLKSSLVALMVLLFGNLSSYAEDAAYFTIGEVDVPNFMGAVTDFGAYVEKVKPGTSMLLAGGAMALSFKFPGFNLNSGIRAVGYADSQDPVAKSHYAVILKPSGAVELQDRFKSGKTTLFVRKLDGKAMLSDSMDFLKTFKSLPVSPKLIAQVEGVAKNKQPAIYMKSLPAEYFKKAGDSLPSIKKLLSNVAIKGAFSDPKASGKKSVSENALETFLRQCQSIETRVYASSKNLILHLTVSPSPGSKLQGALKSLNGELSNANLNDVVSKALADPSFKLTEKFDKAVNTLSEKNGDRTDVKSLIAMLPKLRFSASGSRMLIDFKLPPEVLRSVLLEAGLIQKAEPETLPQPSK